MIDQFSSENITEFRRDFAKAVAALEAQYGVKVTLGRITYNATEFRGKITVTTHSNAPVKADLAKRQWITCCDAFGLKPEWFGVSFTYNGKTFQITGLNLRARRYEVETVEIKTGKKVRFNASGLKRLLTTLQVTK